ncbi:PIG-L deacetylase family protein [Brevibacillus halotolerans]|uniref:PIG-L deacetylase family protein n=1 Tax=Brevibacillus halotolerans TaxID=1507437 RepID=UPI0015EF999B|nr:PIG-L deacetylase family protein [Brevibacillus halotolerans]MBA4534092.1 PIG-L family deacetylase [Brevibacillus halotolerans]
MLTTQKGILLIYAHPDDETFASGATIAFYKDQANVRQTLLCATRGQAGKAGTPPLCTPEELPAYREAELRHACDILGVDRVAVLDYEDKLVDNSPIQELAAHIKAMIDEEQPQILITFAPHGISGHPDHIAMSKATQYVVDHLLDDSSSVRKLYHATIPLTDPFTSKNGTPTNGDSLEAITTIIDQKPYREQIAKALLAHKTQHLSVERVFPGITSHDYKNVPTTNYYLLAWHNLPNYQPTEKETDLFAGIQ